MLAQNLMGCNEYEKCIPMTRTSYLEHSPVRRAMRSQAVACFALWVFEMCCRGFASDKEDRHARPLVP